jgi:hypothetical protein
LSSWEQLPRKVAVFLIVILERKNLSERPQSIHSQKSLAEAISQVPEEHQRACEVGEIREVLDVEFPANEGVKGRFASRRTIAPLSVGNNGGRTGWNLGNAQAARVERTPSCFAMLR